MSKFTHSERLAAAKAVEAGDSLADVGRQFEMSPQVLRRSFLLYQECGAAGFFTKNASYTVAQKMRVLEVIRSQSLSHDEAAVKFGIKGATTIREWERRYLENGMDGLTSKKKGRRPRASKLKAPLTPYEQLRRLYLENYQNSSCDIFFINHIITYPDSAHQMSMKIGTSIKKSTILCSHGFMVLH